MFDALAAWNDSAFRSPAGQMAADEALLHSVTSPTLRVYQWANPALTFGYPQHWSDAAAAAGERPVVRRWTGGGMVFHGEDRTFSIAIPPGSRWASATSPALYAAIHRAIAAACGPLVRLAGAADVQPGPQCFQSPAQDDLLAGNAKIGGGAIRRCRSGILYQGSLQFPAAPDFQTLASSLCPGWLPFQNTAAVERQAHRLELQKYATEAWNRRR